MCACEICQGDCICDSCNNLEHCHERYHCDPVYDDRQNGVGIGEGGYKEEEDEED
jgi:hypothetical protein